MIVLITGVPGAGKTLYALNWVKAKAEKEGRTVYYSGIADLNTAVLPWTECKPEEWHKLPAGALVVVDECQRVFRPRMHGSAVPEFVEKLETHRHLGIDLVFITQHPMLVDTNVRRLVGLHFHVMRRFGAKWATVHEWGGVREGCDKNRADSVRHDFRYPVESFGWYKSAELHTHKLRVPARVWVLLAVPFVAVGAMYYGYRAMAGSSGSEAAAASESAASASALSLSPSLPPRDAPPASDGSMSVADYLRMHSPRVRGLAYTAPVYDSVTQPTEAPYPAACIQSASRCQCYTQQGTRLNVPRDLCRSISEGGFFVAWRQDGTQAQSAPAAQAPATALPVAVSGPTVASLGGVPHGTATAKE